MSTKTASKNKIKFNWLLVPVILMFFVPLVQKMSRLETKLTQFPWFTVTYTDWDVYLICRAIAMFIIVGLMAMYILFCAMNEMLDLSAFDLTGGKKKLCTRWYVLMVISWALMVISTILSKWRGFGFTWGIIEQHENIYVLTCYTIVMLYAYLVISSEADVMILQWPLWITVMIISGLGILQKFGIYYEKWSFVHDLTLGSKYLNEITWKGTSYYSTLYHWNYISLYALLVIPIEIALVVANKSLFKRLLWVIATGATLYFTLYSRVKTVAVAAVIVLVMYFITMFTKMIKKPLLAILSVGLAALLVVAFFTTSSSEKLGYLSKALFSSGKGMTMDYFRPEEDGVYVSYKGVPVVIGYDVINQGIRYWMTDENGNQIELYGDENGIIRPVNQEKYYMYAILFQTVGEDDANAEVPYVSELYIDDKDSPYYGSINDGMYFIYNDMLQKYQYVTYMLRVDDSIRETPTWIFNNHLDFASDRGYIWGKTLPLMFKHFILGSGADSFMVEFPNNDYVSAWNGGYRNTLISKPHCWYMQVWVQQGGLSAILMFGAMLMYLWDSFKMYRKADYKKNRLNYVGLGWYLGIVGYMASGLANDSSLALAPLFWTILGMGYAINRINHRENA